MVRLGFKSEREKVTVRHSFILLVLLVILDYTTKYMIVHSETLSSSYINIIPGFFNIVYVKNTGAAFGLFYGNNIALFFIALVALVLLILFYRAVTEGWPERYYALGMIISGIIGNAIDRLTRHSVVDFLDFYLGGYHWPAFNVADSAICIGVAILIISFLLRPDEKKKYE
ncbi:MAG: signal peptidase II [Victivallales bacterium]|nr:signal peptidase II [Victivallales bacterium]